MVPPPDALDDGGWRASVASHYPTVSGFLRLLTAVIEFGANTEGEPVLAAMRELPQAMAHRSRTHSATALPLRLIDTSGGHRRVEAAGVRSPPRTDGLVDRNAYVFCVLEQFHRQLKRREIFAPGSSRWRDRTPSWWTDQHGRQ